MVHTLFRKNYLGNLKSKEEDAPIETGITGKNSSTTENSNLASTMHMNQLETSKRGTKGKEVYQVHPI